MSESLVGWSNAPVGDLVNIIRGVTFPASSKVHQVSDDVVACLRTSHIQEKLLWDNIYFIPKQYVRREEQLTRRNDILMSMANSVNLVGKVCINETDEAACFGAFLAAIRCSDVNHKYIYYFLRSSGAQSNLRSTASQTVNIANISVAELEKLEIPLAPLAEQKRIAQKLDALLAQVDTLKARIDAIPALLKRFRRTTLSAMLSKSQIEGGEDWKTASISELCTAAFDGPFGSKLKSDDYADTGVRVVRLENIGHLEFLEDKVTYVSIEKGNELSKNRLAEGDILFSSFVDEEVRVCRLPRSEEIFINKADCFCLRVNPKIANARFVMLALSSRESYQKIRASVHGATRPRINLGYLKSFEIRFPPIEEQAEIVRRVEQLFVYADQLETKVTAAQKRIDALTQSLLAKAFRGELVPQDPNDEPASVLLERIRAQRAAPPKPKRGRKSRT